MLSREVKSYQQPRAKTLRRNRKLRSRTRRNQRKSPKRRSQTVKRRVQNNRRRASTILRNVALKSPYRFRKNKQLRRVGLPSKKFQRAGIPSRKILRVSVLSVDKVTAGLSCMRRCLCVLRATLDNNSMETALFITKVLGRSSIAVDELGTGKSCASTNVKLPLKSNDNCTSGA